MKKLLIISLFSLLFLGCFHEEGTVNIDDCRTIVQLKSDSSRLQLQSFVCNYSRDQSGKITGGVCIRVELADGIFSKTGKCNKAYVYAFSESNLPSGFKKGW